MKRKGCIYSEVRNNLGKGHNMSNGSGGGTLRRGVGFVPSTYYRWVAEISYHGRRYRLRSTNFANVQSWLQAMSERFSD